MSWSINPDLSYLHAGTNRDFLLADGTLGTLGAMFLRVAQKSSNIKGVLLSDPSGENCWEAGIEGANAVIRKVMAGVEAAASDSHAHGLAGGTPFSMRVDLEGSVIKVFINGVTPAICTFDVTGDAYLSQSNFGFVSKVNNGLLLQAFKCPLIPNVLPALKALVWVVNGDIWYATRDPATGIARAALAKRRALASTQTISGTEFHQKLYFCDGVGGHQIFDAATLSVSAWVRTGITDPFYLVCAHQARVFGVVTTDKQNAYGSAVNDATDYDTADQSDGAAYGLTESDMPRIGEPIRAMFPATKTALVFACSRSHYVNTGDPVLGGFEVTPLVHGIGGSGMNAMCLTPRGAIACHTTDGLCIIVGGQLLPLSSPILTDFIQVDHPFDNFTVSLVRDPSLHGLLIFLTPITPGPAVHVWYDERTGQYATPSPIQPSLGGFWLEQYPDDIGPTAVCDWDGTIVLGGRDGYLRTYDTTQANFDGQAINWRLPVCLAASSDLNHDTIIQEVTVVRGDTAGEFNVVFYGGRTAEEAMAGEDRTLLIRKTTTGRETIMMPMVRAPAVAIELSALTYNVVGILEAVQVVTTPGELSRFARMPASETAFGNSSQRGGRQNLGGATGPGGGTTGGGGGFGGSGGVITGTATGTGTFGTSIIDTPYPVVPPASSAEEVDTPPLAAGPA